MGAGALVYMYLDKLSSPRWSRILGYASPAALIALLLCFYAPQEYGAWVTLIAVFLTAVLLASSTYTVSSKLLSFSPMVYVGKISYSLYLWHWPIVSLAPLILPSSWRFSVLYAFVMGLAAVCSYHWIEKPLRKANWTSRKVRDIGLGFACSAALSVVVLSAMTYKGSANEKIITALYPASFLPILHSGLPYMTCVVDEKRPMTPKTFDQCTIPPSKTGKPTIWAMGDSHSGHLQNLLYKLHDTFGFGIHSVETPGHVFPSMNGIEYPPRKLLYDRVLENLEPGDIVLISRLYLGRKLGGVPQRNIPEWLTHVSSLAKALAERDVSLVVTGPPPMFFFEDIRECGLDERVSCSVERSKIAPSVDSVMERLVAVKNQNSNVIVFNMFDFLCPAEEERCYPDDGTRFLYRDADHFNSFGSQLLAEPFAKLLKISGVL